MKFVSLHSRGVVSNSVSIMREVTRTRGGKSELMSTVEVLKCREHERYAVQNVQGSRFSYFCKLAHTQNL